MERLIQWVWMQQLLGCGSRRAHEALARCGSPQGLLALSDRERATARFLDKPGLCKAVASPDFASARRIVEAHLEADDRPLTYDDPRYPDCLRQIHSPPLVLWAKGDLSLLGARYRIAMVGSRNPDEYGLAVARKLSFEVAALGGVVVSGLAKGIDAACHRGALEADGATIAVTACGLDRDYPAANHALRGMIERQGLVLSEYPLGVEAHPGNFAVRNRLLSGLSLAAVLVQGRRHSGGAITMAHALAQDRDVFAVPGSILSPLMEGCNALLGEGAAPALSGAELLARYLPVYGYPLREGFAPPPLLHDPPVKSVPATQPEPALERPAPLPDYLDERQAALLTALREGSRTPDALCEHTGQSWATLLGLITQLELLGLAVALPGGLYAPAQR